MIERPGVYELSMDEYQKDPVVVPSLSSGIAHRLVTQSPLHAWFAHPRLNPNHVQEEDKTFDLGACAHALLLEGEDGIAEIRFLDWRKKEAQEARDAARGIGKIPVLSHKLEECRTMALVARAALATLGDLNIELAAGHAERVFVWQEGKSFESTHDPVGIYGAMCRARPDWHAKDRSIFLDYKSTAGSAEPNAWIRNQMGPLGYDMQAVHYLRGNARTGGPEPAQWVFLVQENYPPYACSFVGLSPGMREIAQRKWNYALALWRNCLHKNEWNGYPKAIAYAEPSTWQMDEDEMLRLTFDERLELASV